MPELQEQLYCSQQIIIPPKFPYVLKKFAKAAIKTQPHDLLRWSMEYFVALAEDRIPPVKTRLEYPIFNTEGGLSRGYLKILVKQLEGCTELSVSTVENRWKGSCLELEELQRILCLCDALYLEKVDALKFFAVAAGMLTKSLTQTMLLICELLTNEPDGGSATIPVSKFLEMYTFLARIDASADVKYINGVREGADGAYKTFSVKSGEDDAVRDEVMIEVAPESFATDKQHDEQQMDEECAAYTKRGLKVQYHSLLGTMVPVQGGCLLDMISTNLNIVPERSKSAEKIISKAQFQYEVERHERNPNDPRELLKDKVRQSLGSSGSMESGDTRGDEAASGTTGGKTKHTASTISQGRTSTQASYDIRIIVLNEDCNEIPLVIDELESATATTTMVDLGDGEEDHDVESQLTVKQQVALLKKEIRERRAALIEDIEETFAEIEDIARFIDFASYDLGVITGRQMSATSGEFVVNAIEREIWTNVEQQIALLPDPSTRKRKATPEQVKAVRDIVEDYMREALEVVIPEQAEEEELMEEEPDIVMVYAIPGIGPTVVESIIEEFTKFAREAASRQAECIMPRNLRHFLCPPLEKYSEQSFDSSAKE